MAPARDKQQSSTTIQNVTRAYGLRARAIRARSSHYLAAAGYRVQTGRGSIFVKPFRNARVRVSVIAKALRLLRQRGYRYATPWLRTPRGRDYVFAGGRSYYVTRWLRGQAIRRVSEDYVLLGRALGALHGQPQRPFAHIGLPVKSPWPNLRRQFSAFEAVVSELSSAEATTEWQPWEQWVVRHLDTAKDLSLRAWGYLDSRQATRAMRKYRQAPTLLHGDITRPNLLRTRSAPFLWLLDWDSVALGCPMVDLASALTNTTDFDTHLMGALLRGYEKERPLSAGDRQLLLGLCLLPREAWRVARAVRRRTTEPDTFHALSATWDDRLAAAEWLQLRVRKGGR